MLQLWRFLPAGRPHRGGYRIHAFQHTSYTGVCWGIAPFHPAARARVAGDRSRRDRFACTLVAMALLVGLANLALAPVARAGDGVLEINQACAEGDGCFPGDGPGLPVQITNAAPATSFRLTSDLVVPTNTLRGIHVTASQISIDLGGFAILGASCVGSNSDCTPAAPPVGTIAHGIDATLLPFSAMSGLRVSNGQIVGMGGKGISAPPRSTVEGVEVRFNADSGIRVLESSALRDVVANRNGGHGVELDRGTIATRVVANDNALDGLQVLGFFGEAAAIVRDSVFRENGQSGIRCLGEAARIENNVASRNGQAGIDCDNASHITNNTVVTNQGNGIVCDGDGLIADNTVTENGGSTGIGIECTNHCLVRGNLVRGAGVPLSLSLLDAAYADNVFFRSGASANPTAGVNLGGNLCNGAPCP